MTQVYLKLFYINQTKKKVSKFSKNGAGQKIGLKQTKQGIT